MTSIKGGFQMRKSIKISIAIFILAITLLTPVAYAKVSIPEATSDFYVNDFAGVFSSSEKAQLMEKAVALSDEYDGIQVVVTTVKSLEGNSIEKYSYEMYNQYGIGRNDMGLLILLATEDRYIRVETGKSMEGYINDSKAGRFIDKYAIPSLRENKFNEGLINLQGALIDEVVSCVAKNVDSTKSSDSEDKEVILYTVGILLILTLLGVLVFVLVFFINKIKTKIRARKEKIEQLKKELARKEEIASNREESLNGEISSLSIKIDVLNDQYRELINEYNTLKVRYEMATKLYPTVDSEVTNMIEEEIRQRDMDSAQKVDSIIAQLINIPASKDIVSKLCEAKNYYSRLTEKQKSYVKSDITKLNRLYDESLKLKQEYEREVREEKSKKLATETAVAITGIISGISIGRASHLSRLRRAKSLYSDLASDARKYFDSSISDELDKLYRQAKRDEEDKARKRKEEEERRRRNSHHRHSSSSGFGSSSHSGGFGGHSGGGGASRGF